MERAGAGGWPQVLTLASDLLKNRKEQLFMDAPNTSAALSVLARTASRGERRALAAEPRLAALLEHALNLMNQKAMPARALVSSRLRMRINCRPLACLQ